MPDKNEKTFTMDEVNALVSRNTEQFFEKFAPILESIALTPAKLREAQKPYVDPDVIARNNFERGEFYRLQRESDDLIKAQQAACPHIDRNQKYTIKLQHNFHDNMPRGICVRCNLYIEPAHWESRPVINPDGSITNKREVIEAHPMYWLVQQLETTS
jgi:hypothetical protein